MKSQLMSISGFTLWREDKNLLENISFELNSHEIISVIGPTGAGKGLLLKALLGIHRGKLTGTFQKSEEFRMGMMSRGYPAIDEFTVFENLSLIAKMKGVSSQTHMAEEIEEVLKKVDLWSEIKSKLHIKVEKLKFFEKTRLNLARTLLLEPNVLALYRPTVNLDTDDKARFEVIIEYVKEEGTGVLWVSNDLEQVARVSDRVLFLKQGKMVEFGACEKIFTMPENYETELYVSRRVNV
jgi:phosphate transport system ATP-binding protein